MFENLIKKNNENNVVDTKNCVDIEEKRAPLSINGKFIDTLERYYYIYGDIYTYDNKSVFLIEYRMNYKIWITVSSDNYYYLTVDYLNTHGVYDNVHTRVSNIITKKAKDIEELVDIINETKEKIDELSKAFLSIKNVVAYKKIIESEKIK